jgi:predicted signal transduction protein with EAL and GGDEF domain
VTLSVGLAFAAQSSVADAETLIRSADRALYRAKRAGRNRVKAVDCGPSLRQQYGPVPKAAEIAARNCAASD